MTDTENTQPEQKARPIINCHTHIFKGDHVPHFLAKQFLPWPFYLLLNTKTVVAICRWWFFSADRFFRRSFFKYLAEVKTGIHRFFIRISLISNAGILYILLQSVYILYGWIPKFKIALDLLHRTKLPAWKKWMADHYLLLEIRSIWLQILLVFVVLVFIPSGRNFLLFIVKQFYKLPGKKTKEMLARYMNIGRFSFHKDQSTIFEKLYEQYPLGTAFVVLPMDMEYMNAGKVPISYPDQMIELAGIKLRHPDSIYPFVFGHPERIKKDPNYFDYEVSGNSVILKDCFIKKYFYEHKFNGLKIYPALGYFPFEPELLALFKFACDNGIPVTTHCIRGVIFYRGDKKAAWDHHPILEQAMGDQTFHPLLLPETDNFDFTANFTHPLNFLCLLEEPLLRKAVAAADPKTKKLFGYTNDDTPLTSDLNKLKINLAHFGGDDEWDRFFELDRSDFSNDIYIHPEYGIDFMTRFKEHLEKNEPKDKWKRRLELIWKTVDWYSIITSMMMQYENVYADISYIAHNDAILPLLKSTLKNPRLAQKILYGTDFYVVRNHKSDKNILTDIQAGLDTSDFDLIARENPIKFLSNKISFP